MKKNKKISEKLKIRNFKLKTLLEVTNAINENASKKILYGIFEDTLVNHLGIKKLALITDVDGKWTLEIEHNTSINLKLLPEIIASLQHVTTIEVIRNSTQQVFNQFDVIVPVFHKEKPLAYLFLGDLYNDDELEISPIIKHLPFIQTISNIITVAIQNKILYKKLLEQAALKRELELAAEMQKKLVPDNFLTNRHLISSGLYFPFKKVGGDYYDLMQLSENNYFVCIADVSGKGISAALLMSNFQAQVRALAQTGIPLKQLIIELNNRIYDLINGEKFITFFAAYINVDTKTINYVNCGHHPPMLWCNNQPYLLDEGTTMLGVFKNLPGFAPQQINFSKPCKLFLYTDGLMDFENKIYAPFTLKEIQHFLQENSNKPIAKTIDLLKSEIEKKLASDPQRFQDDITVLMLQFL